MRRFVANICRGNSGLLRASGGISKIVIEWRTVSTLKE